MERGQPGPAKREDYPLARGALGLAGVAVVLFVLAMFIAGQDRNEWLWPLAGLIGGIAAITGWAAGRPRPRGQALAAAVAGGLVFAVVFLWAAVAVITGSWN